LVYLSRIYTKAGDGGETRLGNGTKVPKTDARVEAYGTVDELSASIGAVLSLGRPRKPLATTLRRIQNELFDCGADLCVPLPSEGAVDPALRMTAACGERLEREIDRATADQRPLRSFVLPGGTGLAALLHVARTVCRRAERRAFALAAKERVNPHALVYLNRLSDLLFVMARGANRGGRGDVLWRPGASRSSEGVARSSRRRALAGAAKRSERAARRRATKRTRRR
jgi:cob(I)alamin adenosyltransferase